MQLLQLLIILEFSTFYYINVIKSSTDSDTDIHPVQFEIFLLKQPAHMR